MMLASTIQNKYYCHGTKSAYVIKKEKRNKKKYYEKETKLKETT